MEGIGSGFLGEIPFLLNRKCFQRIDAEDAEIFSIAFARCLSNLPNEIFVAFISSG
jgi:hypothetical protein